MVRPSSPKMSVDSFRYEINADSVSLRGTWSVDLHGQLLYAQKLYPVITRVAGGSMLEGKIITLLSFLGRPSGSTL